MFGRFGERVWTRRCAQRLSWRRRRETETQAVQSAIARGPKAQWTLWEEA